MRTFIITVFLLISLGNISMADYYFEVGASYHNETIEISEDTYKLMNFERKKTTGFIIALAKYDVERDDEGEIVNMERTGFSAYLSYRSASLDGNETDQYIDYSIISLGCMKEFKIKKYGLINTSMNFVIGAGMDYMTARGQGYYENTTDPTPPLTTFNDSFFGGNVRGGVSFVTNLFDIVILRFAVVPTMYFFPVQDGREYDISRETLFSIALRLQF